MARAIWKGILKIGRTELPVKLYSAVQDRTIHFRLLHRTDRQPVKQQLVSSDTGRAIDYEEVKKAYPVARGRSVVLEEEDLESVEPKPSRDIEITRFIAADAIDHRFYERPYFLGPDSSTQAYFAAAQALQRSGKEGIARWVMRNRSYVGALRAEEGYLALIALRHADEVIAADSLPSPGGRDLNPREIAMAKQLLKALEGDFVPEDYRDEYRARVLELVETKDRGGRVKVVKFRPRRTEEDKLANALEASLSGLRKASGG